MGEWFNTTWIGALAAVVSIVGIYAAVLIATRLSGLRSLSKMSSFDFATTVATGTLIANTGLSADPPLLRAMVALATIYLLQYAVARLRLRSARIADLIDNQPLLLVHDGRILHDSLRKVRMTEAELRSKLRLENVATLADVRAAVMETTGDVSVVHGATPVDAGLLDGVRGRPGGGVARAPADR